MNTDPKLPSGEIENQLPGAPTEETANNQVEVLQNLEQLIKHHIKQIDDLKIQAKKHKEMLDDIFLNDATYQEHDKKAKEAARVRSMTKSQLMKRTDVYDLAEKIKEMKTQSKELQTALTDYVREYQRLTGVNEIEDEKGALMEIVYSVRLVRKPSKK